MRRNSGCRITENISICGMQSLVMESDKIRITILLDKGCDIIELLYKPKDIDFMWCSPVDIHNPEKCSSTTGNSFHNYLDHNFGGWQEIIPNGGPECNYKGALLGMHGESTSLPWSYTIQKDSIEEIEIIFQVKLLRSPFTLKKIITIQRGKSEVLFSETLTNLANESMSLMWGHHPTLGGSFLDDSCYIETSAKTLFTDIEQDFPTQRLKPNSTYLWNTLGENIKKMPAPNEQVADMFYLKDFENEAWYKVTNRNLGVSFSLHWNKEIMPYAWIWLVAHGSHSYPWYGNTYSLAIEPWSSFPSKGLLQAIANGSDLHLHPKENIHFSMRAIISE